MKSIKWIIFSCRVHSAYLISERNICIKIAKIIIMRLSPNTELDYYVKGANCANFLRHTLQNDPRNEQNMKIGYWSLCTCRELLYCFKIASADMS